MPTAVLDKNAAPATEEELAARYVGDLVYEALLAQGESAKATDVARAVNRQDVDLRLARVVLTKDPRMTAVDRKWTLWTRFEDQRNTVDRNIQRVLSAYGRPMRIPLLANELHHIYSRPKEVYTELLQHLAASRRHYFAFGGDYIAPTTWLLDTSAEDPDEVMFDNFLEDDQVDAVAGAAQTAGVSAAQPGSVAAFLDAVGKPVRNKVVQFLLWRQDPASFDPDAAFASLFLESGAVLLSDGTWIGPQFRDTLLAHFRVMAEQEVSENAEAEAQESAQPLTISDAQRDTLVDRITGQEETVHATNLLEELFDVTPEQRTYDEDLSTIIGALRTDDRVVWVGSDRFRPVTSVPGYVHSVPALLDIPNYHFTDAEGNEVDLLLEDEGLDGGLQREIVNPLAQDVLDEEPVPPPDPNPPSNARAVVKYHHKQIGTLPLCQFPSGFFPPEPKILETEFVLPSGQRTRVWVNNEARLLYGLLDWYDMIPIDSGATFTLERQAPDRYDIHYNDESEPTMFISRNRINELLEMQEVADAEEMPTVEIIRQIMEHYRKGIEYLTLLTEVNVVRRVPRRLVASILSEYQYFTQRGGAWVYDPKKLPQGFDKSKKKYLVKQG